MQKIISIEKDKRKDISNYTAIFENGDTLSIEAKSKEEAEKKILEYLENREVTV